MLEIQSPPSISSEITIGSFERLLSSRMDGDAPERAEFYATSLLEYIDTCFGLDSIKVCSFDVFDTLLLRNDKPELYRYLEISQTVQTYLAEQGIRSCSIWDIYAARLVAFRTCYRTVDPQLTVREGRLNDILPLMVKILGLDLAVVPDLLAIELDYEMKNLRVNPLLQAFLNHPRVRHKSVIFISDMYLSATQIHQLVQHYYPDLQLQATYSSADSGLTKSTGLLYEKVIQALNLDRSSVLHMGDNLHSDVKLAKQHGLKAIHLPIPDVELQRRALQKQQFLKDLVNQGFDLSLVY